MVKDQLSHLHKEQRRSRRSLIESFAVLDRRNSACSASLGIAYRTGLGYGHSWASKIIPVELDWEIQGNGTDPWDAEQLYWVGCVPGVVLWLLRYNATIQHMIAHWEHSMAAQG